MVWLGFGYLLDLRSVFRNCMVRRISVDDSFAYSSIRKCVKVASALCQERTLQSSAYVAKIGMLLLFIVFISILKIK